MNDLQKLRLGNSKPTSIKLGYRFPGTAVISFPLTNICNIHMFRSRSAQHASLKAKALRCSDALSDSLAVTVAKTKAAAQQFPCASAVAEMAEAARTLAARAQDLRRALVRAAEPPSATPTTPATTVPHSAPSTPLTPIAPALPALHI